MTTPKNGGRKQVLDFTLVEKMSDTLPPLVFISLERKDDPCKTREKAGLRFTLGEKMSDTWPFLVFIQMK